MTDAYNEELFPAELVMNLKRDAVLRYGENPHQAAAVYLDPGAHIGVARAQKMQGGDLTFNDLIDADCAYTCVAEFSNPAVVLVKHGNPCGVAEAGVLLDAYKKALSCDPASVHDGIIACNQKIDAALAHELVSTSPKAVFAPEIADDARTVLASQESIGVFLTGEMPDPNKAMIVTRSIAGAFLVQQGDNKILEGESRVVTKRLPTDSEMEDLFFAFQVAKHVKSDAILFAKAYGTLGIGAGQTNCDYAAKIATLKASDTKLDLHGAVMASGGTISSVDCLRIAHEAGVVAIIQPGGFEKDQEVIAAADEYGMAMVFTGIQHSKY